MTRHDLTSAEQLEEIRRVVAWTLWTISTTDDDETLSYFSDNEQKAIRRYAQERFSDDDWMARVAGSFVGHDDTVMNALFEALLKDDGS